MTREQAQEWAARFNGRVPPGKDLTYEVEQTRGGWRVRARHPGRDARPSLRERYGEAVATVLINVIFWGAVLGGCGYLIATSEDSGRREAAGAGAGDCHPDYGGCLDPDAYDYDCAGGSGDGPKYTGYVTVKGADPFGLDADGDGGGCE
jgi:hypothetical protein